MRIPLSSLSLALSLPAGVLAQSTNPMDGPGCAASPSREIATQITGAAPVRARVTARGSLVGRRSLAPLLGLSLLVGACSDARHEAVTELQRLEEAAQRHAAQYGRFPETLDPERPAGPRNLPHRAKGEVALRLLGGGPDRYSATARSGIWLCGMSMSAAGSTPPDCAPAGRAAPEAEAGPNPLTERILDAPAQ